MEGKVPLVKKIRFSEETSSFDMAESEETDLGHHGSPEESDSDSSFEVIEDPENPRVSTMIPFLGCTAT